MLAWRLGISAVLIPLLVLLFCWDHRLGPRAPVLLVWVSGTPDSPEMFKALATPSRSHVVFVDMIDFGEERDAEKITGTLRKRLAEVDRKSTRLNSSHSQQSRMPSSA